MLLFGILIVATSVCTEEISRAKIVGGVGISPRIVEPGENDKKHHRDLANCQNFVQIPSNYSPRSMKDANHGDKRNSYTLDGPLKVLLLLNLNWITARHLQDVIRK